MDWLKEMYEDHAVVLSIVNLLALYARKLEAGNPDGAELDEILGLAHEFTERCHHAKEERALFPAIGKYDKNLTAELLREHEEGKRLVRSIRDGAAGERISCIRSYAGLVKSHVAKENIFFNECYAKVGGRECSALSAAFGRINSEALGKNGGRDIPGKIGKINNRLKMM